MSPSIGARRQSGPVGSLDSVRPTPAKADILRTDRSDGRTTSDQATHTALGTVAADAVVGHYGSVKAAALSMKSVDPSLLMRELHAGKLGRLDDADDALDVKAAVAAALTTAFPAADPVASARRLLRDAQARLDAAQQLLERP